MTDSRSAHFIAWESVIDVLNEVAPGWNTNVGSGIDQVTTAIRKLALSAPAGCVVDARQIKRLLNGDIRAVLLDVSNGIDSPALVSMAAHAVCNIDRIETLLAAAPAVSDPVAGMDEARYRLIARKFQYMKTSEAELFLSTLGLHDADAADDLDSIIDAALTGDPR